MTVLSELQTLGILRGFPSNEFDLTWSRKLDYALLKYIPKNRGVSSKARELVIDFKNGERRAITIVQQMYECVINYNIDQWRNQLGIKYIFVAPSSSTYKLNGPCQQVAEYLDAKFDWIEHIKHGIRRTKTMRKASQSPGNRPSVEEHLQSIEVHVTLPDVVHDGNILLIDDVLTEGTVSTACRVLLQEKFPFANTIGLMLSRTSGIPKESDPPDSVLPTGQKAAQGKRSFKPGGSPSWSKKIPTDQGSFVFAESPDGIQAIQNLRMEVAMWAIALTWITAARGKLFTHRVPAVNKPDWVKKIGEANTERLFNFLRLYQSGAPSYIPNESQLKTAIYAFKKTESRLETLSRGTTKQVLDEIDIGWSPSWFSDLDNLEKHLTDDEEELH